MQIFEYPHVIITIFILCVVSLAAIGIHFAIKGVKTAEGSAERDFTTISKMEGNFKKAAKLHADRCVL